MLHHPLFAWLYWDPDRVFFTIPLIDRPIAWYGIFFTFGLIVSYFLMIPLLQNYLSHFHANVSQNENLHKLLYKQALFLADRMTWYVVAGTIIGARLGHVFFYDWPRYKNHWFDIIKIWEGGLASHGGAVGILLGLFLFQKSIQKEFPKCTFLVLMDLLVIPVAFTTVCIRIGNFINQEILGVVSAVPWAVVFGHPADGSIPAPRHPVQLYEAIAYLLIFFLLLVIKLKCQPQRLRLGVLSGLFFVSAFTVRFLIEFLKESQSLVIDESFLQTGQYLSIPFIFLGFWLLLCAKKNKERSC